MAERRLSLGTCLVSAVVFQTLCGGLLPVLVYRAGRAHWDADWGEACYDVLARFGYLGLNVALGLCLLATMLLARQPRRESTGLGLAAAALGPTLAPWPLLMAAWLNGASRWLPYNLAEALNGASRGLPYNLAEALPWLLILALWLPLCSGILLLLRPVLAACRDAAERTGIVGRLTVLMSLLGAAALLAPYLAPATKDLEIAWLHAVAGAGTGLVAGLWLWWWAWPAARGGILWTQFAGLRSRPWHTLATLPPGWLVALLLPLCFWVGMLGLGLAVSLFEYTSALGVMFGPLVADDSYGAEACGAIVSSLLPLAWVMYVAVNHRQGRGLASWVWRGAVGLLVAAILLQGLWWFDPGAGADSFLTFSPWQLVPGVVAVFGLAQLSGRWLPSPPRTLTWLSVALLGASGVSSALVMVRLAQQWTTAASVGGVYLVPFALMTAVVWLLWRYWPRSTVPADDQWPPEDAS